MQPIGSKVETNSILTLQAADLATEVAAVDSRTAEAVVGVEWMVEWSLSARF